MCKVAVVDEEDEEDEDDDEEVEDEDDGDPIAGKVTCTTFELGLSLS
jgi:hypothetical protein